MLLKMKIVTRANYIIYLDNVRIDPYVIDWSSQISLAADGSSASITLFRTAHMDDFKAYLCQLRIFAENNFTGRFSMVFHGEIMNRSFSSNKSDIGRVTYHAKGFAHWLDIKIPMAISLDDEMNPLQRFIYQAQNIDIDEVRDYLASQSDITMKDQTVDEIINGLFQKMMLGYTALNDGNTTFNFAKVQERFKVLVDVNPAFRESGFLDLFSFSKASHIDSFYTYLNDVVTQLMMEFYQDRDGTFKIKFPFWKDDVLLSQVIDSSIVENISGMDDWENEPTRVLAIGSATQLQQAMSGGDPLVDGDILTSMTIPVGLYIGDPQKIETEQYYSLSFDVEDGGGGGDDFGGGDNYDDSDLSDVVIDQENWFDETPKWVVTSGHKTVNASRPTHNGTDYGSQWEPLHSIGTHGVVLQQPINDASMGNPIFIRQKFNGKVYDFVYMHMQKPTHWKPGQKIKPGDYIGDSGATGRVTGPHLHLEVWEGPAYAGGQNLNSHTFLGQIRNQIAAGKKGPVSEDQKSNSKSKKTKEKKKKKDKDLYGPPAPDNLKDDDEKDSKKAKSGKRHKKGKYIPPNQISGFNASRAGHLPVHKDADLIVTADYGVTAAELNKFLSNKLRNAGKDYIAAGKRYGICPAFLAAISTMETGHGVHISYNNVAGMMSPESNWKRLMRFSTIRDGIMAQARNIQSLYTGMGLITPRTIQPKYCPVPADNDPKGTNKHWLPGVVNFWRALRGEKVDGVEMAGSGSGSGASVTGRGFGVVNLPSGFTSVTDFSIGKKMANQTKVPIETPMVYKPTLLRELPYSSNHLKSVINKNAAGVAPRLIVSIIENFSSFQEKMESSTHIGIMAFPKNLIVGDKSAYKSGPYCIQEGSKWLKKCINAFPDKITFALCAYYLGDITKVKQLKNEHKAHTYLKLKQHQPARAYISFVDNVVSSFVKPEGSHLLRDYHQDLVGKYFMSGDKIMVMGENMVLQKPKWKSEEDYLDESEIEDLPKMSDEERRFKINLIQVEQDLIRQDSGGVGSGDDFDFDYDDEDDDEDKKTAKSASVAIASQSEKKAVPLAKADNKKDDKEKKKEEQKKAQKKADNDNADVDKKSKEKTKDKEDEAIIEDKDEAFDGPTANQLIYQYAKYTMQLHRAKVHNISVNLTLCMPQLRVGFNAWIEPTRTNTMAYITNVSHYGSFNAGCKTAIQAGFLRNPDKYQEIDESIFIGETRAISQDFGVTVAPGQMSSIRGELNAMHAQDVSQHAHHFETLKKYYGSQNGSNEYTTHWNAEKSPRDIDDLIQAEYKQAPEIVQGRLKEVKEVIHNSIEDFIKQLHAQFSRGGA